MIKFSSLPMDLYRMRWMASLAACGSSAPASNAPAQPAENKDSEKAAPAEKIVMRIGIGQSDVHPQYAGLVKFKEEVEANTNGKFEVQINHSGTVGDDRGMMEMLQLGTLDGTCPSSAPLVNFCQDFMIFDFPFLFKDYDDVDRLLDGEVGRELLDKLNGSGMVGMNFWELGFMSISNSKRPIESLDDMKGLKIRTMENEVQMACLESWGANPSPLAFSELFTALQQGTFDGQQNPFASIFSMKFYEVQDYLAVTNHVYNPFIFLVSQSFWDKLTPEEKEIFQAAADAGRDEERRLVREQNDNLLSDLQELGMEVTYLSDADIETMKELAQPVVDKFAKQMDEAFVTRFYEAVNS